MLCLLHTAGMRCTCMWHVSMLHPALQFVRQLADKGNTVVATCREPQKAAELAKLKDVTVIQLDVASPEAIQQWAQDLGSHAQHFDVRHWPCTALRTL